MRAVDILVPLGVPLVIVAACGGLSATSRSGYLDDAGVFHLADGGTLVSGSACTGWDASHMTNGNYDRITSCTNSADCVAWFAPPLWPYTEVCSTDADIDIVEAGVNAGTCDPLSVPSSWPTCDPSDPGSNDFCTAFFSQFIVRGSTGGTCGPNSNECSFGPCVVTAPNGGQLHICEEMSTRGGWGSSGLPRLVDGGWEWAPPCAP